MLPYFFAKRNTLRLTKGFVQETSPMQGERSKVPASCITIRYLSEVMETPTQRTKTFYFQLSQIIIDMCGKAEEAPSSADVSYYTNQRSGSTLSWKPDSLVIGGMAGPIIKAVNDKQRDRYKVR